MTHPASHPLLPYCPSSHAKQQLTGRQRILLYGKAGIGKSTLTKELALELSRKNQSQSAALTTLAHKADFFFCEAFFFQTDIEQARRTGHLTGRACGEIANSADVKQLVPFHFSRRYETRPEAVYLEISDACSHLMISWK